MGLSISTPVTTTRRSAAESVWDDPGGHASLVLGIATQSRGFSSSRAPSDAVVVPDGRSGPSRIGRLGASGVAFRLERRSTFRRLRDFLRDFPDTPVATVDYEEAVRAANQCRRAGIPTSLVDMLVCAIALRHDWEIFSTDRDFTHYRNVLKIRLFPASHEPNSACFSPNTSAMNASMVAPFSHASRGRPALRQVCSRNVRRSQ